MESTFVRALQYIAEVKSMIAGDDRKTYDEFRETLRQYGRRSVDSSIVIYTVKTLFHRQYPNLLEGFKYFVPSHRSAEMAAAVAAEDPRKRSSVDFLNRVRTRLGGGAFCKFLKSMHEFARAEISATGVIHEVVGLLGGNDDLVEEFMSFLRGSCAGEGSKKRKRADLGGGDGECSEQRGMKRRGSDSGSRDGEETAPRRTARRLMTGEEKAAKRVADRDNGMEDSLCAIEVRLSNLKASIKSAARLHDHLADGRLSPADVRLNEHFTPLNLACVRSFHAKFQEDADVDLARALHELLEVLMKKKEAFERERVKIAQRWKLISLTFLARVIFIIIICRLMNLSSFY